MNCTASNRNQGKIEPNTATKLEKALLPCISAYGGDIAKMLRSIPRIKSLLKNLPIMHLCSLDCHIFFWIEPDSQYS